MVHPRGPMSLVNVAYRDALTWGNQDLRTLEQQALVPMLGTTPNRYRQYEDRSAMSEAAIRGSVLFFSNRKARCISCHRGLNLDGGAKTVNTPPAEELVFTFHNTCLYNLQGPLSYPADNTGLYEQTRRPQDVGKFRVPTLRNIAVTAPYMHDGSIATLDEAGQVKGQRAKARLKVKGKGQVSGSSARARSCARHASISSASAQTRPH